jgi:hypothetical protein
LVTWYFQHIHCSTLISSSKKKNPHCSLITVTDHWWDAALQQMVSGCNKYNPTQKVWCDGDPGHMWSIAPNASFSRWFQDLADAEEGATGVASVRTKEPPAIFQFINSMLSSFHVRLFLGLSLRCYDINGEITLLEFLTTKWIYNVISVQVWRTCAKLVVVDPLVISDVSSHTQLLIHAKIHFY